MAPWVSSAVRAAGLAALTLLGCARALTVDSPEPALDPVSVALRRLSPAERASAFRDTASGWFTYPSDGTARGDSARRVLAFALSYLEAGGRERARPLVDVAVAYGVVIPDSLAYQDLDAALRVLGRPPQQRLTILEDIARRWPAWRWVWKRKAEVLRELGRPTEAAAAQAHAASLP